MSKRRLVLSVAVVSSLLSACGGGQSPAPATDGVQSNVSVVLDDWSVTSDPASVPAGTVTFDVTVEAGSHALTVMRTDLPPNDLPRDGPDVVDITDESVEVIGWHGDSDTGFSLETELDPGSYVLICNLGGHYARGMRTGFEVT